MIPCKITDSIIQEISCCWNNGTCSLQLLHRCIKPRIKVSQPVFNRTWWNILTFFKKQVDIIKVGPHNIAFTFLIKFNYNFCCIWSISINSYIRFKLNHSIFNLIIMCCIYSILWYINLPFIYQILDVCICLQEISGHNYFALLICNN